MTQSHSNYGNKYVRIDNLIDTYCTNRNCKFDKRTSRKENRNKPRNMWQWLLLYRYIAMYRTVWLFLIRDDLNASKLMWTELGPRIDPNWPERNLPINPPPTFKHSFESLKKTPILLLGLGEIRVPCVKNFEKITDIVFKIS